MEYLNLSSFKFDNIRTGYSGTNDTFSDVPSNCVVEIKRSQQATFEDKFPLSSSTYDGNRLFNPTPVD